MVRNDVRLGGETRLMVISGSNMSGKSTLLRTVGINAVLALAGAPVRAASLRLSPLAIRRDAADPGLAAGKDARASTPRSPASAQIVDLAASRCRCCSCSTSSCTAPIRTIAASARRAIPRPASTRGAIGLVTTHDLALA